MLQRSRRTQRIESGSQRRRYEPRRSRCMTGAVQGGRLPWQRAEAALRARGPARRRSDARAEPASVAAAPPRAAGVRPPADSACRHTRASRRGPCRSPRRVARRRAAGADHGVLILKSGSPAASIGQTHRLRVTRGVSRRWQIARAYGRIQSSKRRRLRGNADEPLVAPMRSPAGRRAAKPMRSSTFSALGAGRWPAIERQLRSIVGERFDPRDGAVRCFARRSVCDSDC